MKKGMFLAGILILLIIPLAFAYSPPADSPMARGEHPRVFFNKSDVPQLEERLIKYYGDELKRFVAETDGTKYSTIPSDSKERKYGAMNYAFLALIDFNKLESGISGLKFGHTKEEYCGKAVEYFNPSLDYIRERNREYHGMISGGGSGPTYIAGSVVYDWCYPYLGENKEIIAKAFVDSFFASVDVNYSKTPIPLGGTPIHNQITAEIHDILPILSFYNDPFPDSSLMNKNNQIKMFNAFYDVWISRYLGGIKTMYGNGGGSYEGPAYGAEAFLNGIYGVAAFLPALSASVSDQPYFTRYPQYLVANTKPYTIEKISDKILKNITFYQTWGLISGGHMAVGGDGDCKQGRAIAGFLKKDYPLSASLAKWHVQPGRCRNKIEESGLWTTGLFGYFIFGEKEIIPKGPEEIGMKLTEKHGHGLYTIRTGYDAPINDLYNNDTFIAFWATTNHVGNQRQQHHYGHFYIDKFGALAVKGGNGKSGICTRDGLGQKENLYLNLVGNEAQLSFTNGGASSIAEKGEVLAEDINNGAYDYIFLDNSPAWSSIGKRNLSQREFLYLGGPLNKEYLVVYDRTLFNNLKKNWHLWTAVEPNIPSDLNEPVIVTNNYNSVNVANENAILKNHGRLYIKTLYPSLFIRSTNRTFICASDYENEFIGWGRLDIKADSDAFLNVMQIGDSNTLNAMSNVIKIESEDKKMIGGQIKDSGNQWVVMFAKAPERISSTSYTLEGTGEIKHLIANLEPYRTYYLDDKVGSTLVKTYTLTANKAGVVFVTTNLGSTHTFTLRQGELASCTGVLKSVCDSQDKICSGGLFTAKEGVCCLGSCVEKPKPVCAEGSVTQSCLCGGVEVSSGYCCSGRASTTACSTCVSSPEICDGKDNDCDSSIDEGLSCGNVPTAPSNLIVQLIGGKISLNWNDNSNNEASFVIEKSIDGIEWTEIASLPANANSYEEIDISLSQV